MAVRRRLVGFFYIDVQKGAISNPTEDTHERRFDVSREPRHIVRLGDDEYEIQLLQIGQVEEEGHLWPWYEFQVTKRLA